MHYVGGGREMIDLMQVVTVVAPIIAGAAGYFGKRALDQRPRIVWFMASANSVTLGKGGQQPVQINSHVVVIRNDGNLAAKDVRVRHDVFPPDFSVYPGIDYAPKTNPEGFTELHFPLIAPGQQINISYMYFPPTTWSQINCVVYSDTGFGKQIVALPKPLPTFWILWLRNFLMFSGAWAVIYWLARTLIGFAVRGSFSVPLWP